MSFERTQIQGSDEQRRAQQLSMSRSRPPLEVAGYESRRFLGAGAYGEVWVAVDRNTGRQVAIKFYAHRGGLDWSLLLREVEKLAFLSADRYVVQLLDVGWDAEPPYYVMEYVEQGSLDDRLRKDGALPIHQAVELFREVAVGLLHAHGKGVLHCDLKPANVLLDQDFKPRLADFGQSRLSHEQTPALGTLFYMAPEQADMQAVPDARWDVYALGALLYCMLTGAPPHRTDEAVTEIEQAKDLDDRLARYRQHITTSPPPSEHRKLPGMDRALAEIIDRALAIQPELRYPNVQAVLDALDARHRRRARRPLLVLGAVVPALLLIASGLLTWQWFNMAMQHSSRALTLRSLQSNKFTARFVAKVAADELEERFRVVEQLAADRDLQSALQDVLDDPRAGPLLQTLSDPNRGESELVPLRERYRALPSVQHLRQILKQSVADKPKEFAASWLVNDPRGLQLARGAEGPNSEITVGVNFGWRSYFHGGDSDRETEWRPGPDDHVKQTHLSAVFLSQATNQWIVAISTPILKRDEKRTPLGVLSLTVNLGQWVALRTGKEQQPLSNPTRVAVLVDWREGPSQGLILQHPLFDKLLYERQSLPAHFAKYRVTPDNLPVDDGRLDYDDPVSADPEGVNYRRHWLAEMAPVVVRGQDTQWIVIVQEAYDAAIGDTLGDLKHSLLSSGIFAVAGVGLAVTAAWIFVVRLLTRPSILPAAAAPVQAAVAETLPAMANLSRGKEPQDGDEQ